MFCRPIQAYFLGLMSTSYIIGEIAHFLINTSSREVPYRTVKGTSHGPNNYKNTKTWRSSFLKNWPVKEYGGRCLSVWGPSPPRFLFGLQRGFRVQRGLVDSALDCCKAVLGSIPPPGTVPQKTSAGSPAQMIYSAQEESPQRRKFSEDESCKILYCKSRRKKILRSESGQIHSV
jgi:hypothetical protein